LGAFGEAGKGAKYDKKALILTKDAIYFMPIKMTKPRAGSTPMVYFKGSAQGFSRLKPRQRLGGIRLVAPNKVKKELLLAMKAQQPTHLMLAKIEKTDSATHVALRAKKFGNKYLISQAPARHGVTSGGILEETLPSFLGLKKILKEGFRPNHPVFRENVEIQPERSASRFARQSFSSAALKKEERKITKGDSFTIHMNSLLEPTSKDQNAQYAVATAKNSQIVGIIIKLQKRISAENRKAKTKFYKREIQQKYGIPVKFVF